MKLTKAPPNHLFPSNFFPWQNPSSKEADRGKTMPVCILLKKKLSFIGDSISRLRHHHLYRGLYIQTQTPVSVRPTSA